MQGYEKIEKHHRANEHIPMEKVSYKGYEIAVSQGGPYVPSDYPWDRQKRIDYPNGWYESAFAIFFNGSPLVQMPLEFDFLHDITLTQHARIKGRVNAAKKTAMRIIDDWERQGFRIDPESVRARVH